jgi:hypothetical protein
MKSLKVTAVTLLLGALATIGHSAPIVYANWAAWNSATTGVTLDDYESHGWTSTGGDGLGTAVVLGGVSYSYNGSQIYCVGPALTYDAAYLSGSYLEWQWGGTMTASLGGSYSAFAVDFGDFYGLVRSFTFAFDNGDVFSVSGVSNGFAFFGVTTDTAFTSVSITASDDFAVIDNLAFGSPGTDVPDAASTFALLGVALSMLAFGRRRLAA